MRGSEPRAIPRVVMFGREPDPAVEARVRPPVLPVRLDLAIEGYTLINWAVPPERLADMLAPGLRPILTEQADGLRAWLSLWLGRVVLRGVGGLAAPPVSFAQANYRTYVEGPRGRRLWIFRSVIGPPIAGTATQLVLGFPSLGKPYHFAPRLAAGRLTSLVVEIGDGATELALEVESVEDAPWTPGLASPEAATALLGDVAEALYPLEDGRFGLMVARHPPLEPEAGRIVRIEPGWLVRRGLLTRAEARHPASIFMQAELPFPTHA